MAPIDTVRAGLLKERWSLPVYETLYRRPVKLKILFLCEGLSFDSPNGFSFARVIDALRDNAPFPYADFELTLARWGSSPGAALSKDPSPGDHDATYTNYRFDDVDPDTGRLILEDHDEVWIFGIGPNSNQPQTRSSILASAACPTDGELRVVKRYMDAGHGVFCTGDHASLGAWVAARIPRVWTMRRWTEEDDAPPRTGSGRIDTNRPMWASQEPRAGTPEPEIIPFEAQSDDVPQRIEWKRYPTHLPWLPYALRGARPHPILCGGRHGVIDVFPDHPHEGIINERSEIDLDADVQFDVDDGDDAAEYPTRNGVRPLPEVIAWGNTLPASDAGDYDPFTVVQEKGESPAKRFGLLGVYDGHRADLGRVVVDSTWHHWMSINLTGAGEPVFPSDPDPHDADGDGSPDHLKGLLEAGGPAIGKILTYFRNVAVWLAPKAQQSRMLRYMAWREVLGKRTFEDWDVETPKWQLGVEGRDVLGRKTSHCVISKLILDRLPFDPDDLRIPRRPPEGPFPPPWGPVCLSCPPDDWLETVVLGELLHDLMVLRDDLAGTKMRLDDDALNGLEAKMDRLVDVAASRATDHAVEAAAGMAEALDGGVGQLRKTVDRGRERAR